MTDAAEALKRSARRRLIGAVALALITVVALPMIFDKEPPSLAEVEIVSPSRDTPGSVVLLEGGADARTGLETPSATSSLPAPVPSPTIGSPAVSPSASVAPVPGASNSAPVSVQKPAASAVVSTSVNVDLSKVSPSAANGYFLQLGVFSSEEGARTLAKRVADAGFTVHVVEDAGRHKVRCGPVSAKSAAQDLQTRLRNKGFPAVLVAGP